MKIRRIAAYRVELPLHEGNYKWSGGKSVAVFDSTIVEVEADDGTLGHGEVCPLGSAYLPAFASGRPRGDRRAGAAPDRRGSRRSLGQLNRRMDAAMKGHPVREVGDRRRLLGPPSARPRGCRSATSSAGGTARTSSSTGRSRRNRPRRWPGKRRGVSGRGLPAVPAQGRRRPGCRHRADQGRGRRARARRQARRRRQHRLADARGRPGRPRRPRRRRLHRAALRSATRNAWPSAAGPTSRSSSTSRSTASAPCSGATPTGPSTS